MKDDEAQPENALQQLLLIMSRLRDPQHGCPWDLQQTFVSIAPHTLEEVYEVIDAIESGDMEQLKNELGDLLFQVVFYAQLGRERQLFDFNAIAAEISHKLLHRHPHVFPDASLDGTLTPGLTPDEVAVNWETIKTMERQRKHAGRELSVLDDVPLALTALLRAAKLQKRAAGQGFDWKNAAGVFGKLGEEITELQEALARSNRPQVEEEFGDLLFTLVNLARHLDLNPETSLRQANRKFESRFRHLERLVREDGKEMKQLSEAQLDAYWERVKSAEKNP